MTGSSRDQSPPITGGRPQEAPSQEFELDPKSWEVEVRLSGERILTIGHSHYSGLADIDRYADAVRNCAEHLMAFIGPEEPSPCFVCGGTGQERWMGACGEEVGPCSICMPQLIVCPICGGHDDDRQLMCEACGGSGQLGELSAADGASSRPTGSEAPAEPREEPSQ